MREKEKNCVCVFFFLAGCMCFKLFLVYMALIFEICQPWCGGRFSAIRIPHSPFEILYI